MKKKTHEEYVVELKNKNPNLEVVGEYINAKTKVLHKCRTCNYEWYCLPSHALNSKNCPMCNGSVKYNHEEYVEKVSKINPDIKVVGEYKGVRTKITHYCKKHNVYFDMLPSGILKGCGCNKCKSEKISNSNGKTHKQYIKELSLVNSNVIVLGEYSGATTPILHKCLKHEFEWYISPNNALHGNGCDKCKSEKIAEKRKCTHEEYLDKIACINPDIEVVEKYIDATTKILHRCRIDGYEWRASPHCILQGTGCPKCCESKGEKAIRQWLEKHNIIYTYQMPFVDCCDVKPLPFDFYLPELNICIEYDGIQHFESIDFANKGKEWAEKQLKYTQKHDKIKTDYCANNNIKLLRIPYYANVEEELDNFLFI